MVYGDIKRPSLLLSLGTDLCFPKEPKDVIAQFNLGVQRSPGSGTTGSVMGTSQLRPPPLGGLSDSWTLVH